MAMEGELLYHTCFTHTRIALAQPKLMESNYPKSVVSVMMIIASFLNLFVKPIERTQTCLKLALARKGRI